MDSLVFDVVGEFGVRDFGDRDLGTNDFLDGDEGFPAGDGDAPEKLVDFMEDWTLGVPQRRLRYGRCLMTGETRPPSTLVVPLVLKKDHSSTSLHQD